MSPILITNSISMGRLMAGIIATKRAVNDCSGGANGSTSSGEFSTWTEAGYDFHFGDFAVGPMGALQYTLVHVDGFSERGSLLPLQIHSNQEASLRTDLGVRATYTWHLGKVLVIPTLTAAWEHEYFYTALPI